MSVPSLTVTDGDLRRRRRNPVVPVLGTIVVVVLEFLLLTAVYSRPSAVGAQRVVLAHLAGAVRADAPAAQVRQEVLGALPALRSAGLSSVRLGELRRAAADYAAAPHAVSAGSRLRELVASIGRGLAGEQARIDRQAKLIFAGLLTVASVGWMVWFRRLVARHRALQRRLTEQEARSEGEKRLAALIHNSADIVLVLDAAQVVTFVTPSSERVLGITADELTGAVVWDWVHPDDHAGVARLFSAAAPGQDQGLSIRMLHADSQARHMEGSLTNLVAEPAVHGWVLTVRDVSERIDLETRLSHQALHDSLTGLANRRLFGDRLNHALQKRRAAPMAVLYCDLDDFKDINDRLGHAIGDDILVAVGARIRDAIRAGDTAARLGGDEFAILIDDVGADEARSLAAIIQEAINEPIDAGGQLVCVQACIGVALAVAGEIDGADALRNADVAMYLAKDQGKSRIALYQAHLHTEALDRLQLRADLDQAIRSDELLLHYQPTIDLATDQIVGFEALVRWHHPTRGLLGPGLFIPIAEQSGLIVALGSWVLRQACHAATDLHRTDPSLRMSVNVAAQQLVQPGFVQDVTHVLAETGLAPNTLVLEITESVVLEGMDQVVPKLTALRELGVRIAIDDFGTGYSALSYIRDLPVDILKLDKAFIDRITLDEQDAALADTIITMSTRMNLTTVAEGVEDHGQAEWLTAAHCTYGQGFLWSKPVPLTTARDLLTRHNTGASTRPRLNAVKAAS